MTTYLLGPGAIAALIKGGENSDFNAISDCIRQLEDRGASVRACVLTFDYIFARIKIGIESAKDENERSEYMMLRDNAEFQFSNFSSTSALLPVNADVEKLMIDGFFTDSEKVPQDVDPCFRAICASASRPTDGLFPRIIDTEQHREFYPKESDSGAFVFHVVGEEIPIG